MIKKSYAIIAVLSVVELASVTPGLAKGSIFEWGPWDKMVSPAVSADIGNNHKHITDRLSKPAADVDNTKAPEYVKDRVNQKASADSGPETYPIVDPGAYSNIQVPETPPVTFPIDNPVSDSPPVPDSTPITESQTPWPGQGAAIISQKVYREGLGEPAVFHITGEAGTVQLQANQAQAMNFENRWMLKDGQGNHIEKNGNIDFTALDDELNGFASYNGPIPVNISGDSSISGNQAEIDYQFDDHAIDLDGKMSPSIRTVHKHRTYFVDLQPVLGDSAVSIGRVSLTDETVFDYGKEKEKTTSFGDALFVAGVPSSMETIDTLKTGNMVVNYQGTSYLNNTPVEMRVNFGDSTWTGSWNNGKTGNNGMYTGNKRMIGDVGFNAAGKVTGNNFNGAVTSASGATVTGTVNGTIYGSAAQSVGGITDVQVMSAGSSDSFRNLDIFTATKQSAYSNIAVPPAR